MRFENQTFENTAVTLDCNQFVNCVIKDCHVVLHSGPWSIERVRFEGKCTLAIANNSAAAAIIQFLKLIRFQSPQLFEQMMSSGAQPSTQAQRTTLN